MKKVLFSLKNHKYLSYKPSTIYPQCYGYNIPYKNPLTMEKVQGLNLKKGSMTYIHLMPKNPKLPNLGHQLIRRIRLGFCTKKELQIEEQLEEQKEEKKVFHLNDMKIIANLQGNQSVSYTLDEEIKGNRGNQIEGLYVLAYTCKVCETKQARSFTKHAYHKGVVLIRCEGCEKLHLIADNLGWFEDDPVNVEQLMERQGHKVHKLNDTKLSKDQIDKIIKQF